MWLKEEEKEHSSLLSSLSKTAEEKGRITNYREFCGGTMEYILGNIINVNVQNELLELGVIATKVKEKCFYIENFSIYWRRLTHSLTIIESTLSLHLPP